MLKSADSKHNHVSYMYLSDKRLQRRMRSVIKFVFVLQGGLKGDQNRPKIPRREVKAIYQISIRT